LTWLPLTWLLCGAPGWSPKASTFATAVITAPLDREGVPQPDLLQRSRKGGHFAAWEQPQLFSEELRATFRTLR
jgi:pimeloyl-ACP methyl ester carboxylesterase